MKQIILFLFCSILFISCTDNIKPTALSGSSKNIYPEQEGWNNTVTFSDSGMVRAILIAGHLTQFQNSSRTIIDEGMKIHFFNNYGVHSSILTAQSGWADEESKDLYAKGDVKIISDSGVVVESTEMNWSNTTQKVFSDKFVKIISKTEILQGHGFESDHNLQNYKIFKVSGTAQSVE
ncbi:MAG: LPS export ABC transporter periplasmic protein LptC [Bacteroidota bacterium]